MVFPLSLNLRWDGHVDLDESIKINVNGEILEPYMNWDYRVVNIDQDTTILGMPTQYLTIEHIDESTIIDRRYSKEVYAKGLGLVYKEMIILDSDGSNPLIPWPSKAQKGFILRQKLVEIN